MSKAEEFKKSILESHRLTLPSEDLSLLSGQLDLLITYAQYDIPSIEVGEAKTMTGAMPSESSVSFNKH